MRVVFLGTPDFAVPALQSLQEAEDMEVLWVISQPDRARSRGKVSPTPVKQAAESLHIPVSTPLSVNEDAVFERLQELAPEVLVVIAYGQKIGDRLLEAYPERILNIHGSLLPKYRGAAPIQRAMLNGEKELGLTAMLIAEKMDAGDMLAQASIPVQDEDLKEMSQKLAQLSATLLLDTLRHYPTRLANRRMQEESKVTYAKKIRKEDGVLDFRLSAEELVRKVRTLHDWPGARFTMDGEDYRVHRAHVESTQREKEVGVIVDASKKGLAIQTGEGIFVIESIQAPGKKTLRIADFLNGHTISVGTVLPLPEAQNRNSMGVKKA